MNLVRYQLIPGGIRGKERCHRWYALEVKLWCISVGIKKIKTFFLFQIFFFFLFLSTLDRVLLAESMRNSVKIFLNYVQVMGLKLLKVLSSDITKWNPRMNCSEARGMTSNGLWGMVWLTNSSLCSLTSFTCFQPFLVIPQRGHPSVLLKSDRDFFFL